MKGISPLIAGVLLVAFTIAVAALVSQFFISSTAEQITRSEEKGDDVVDCGSTSVKILASTTSWNGTTLTVNVENTGSVAAQIPEMIILNDTNIAETITGPVPASGYGGTALNTTSNTLPSGGMVTFRESVTYNPKRVTVRTSCPGKSSTVENDTSDGTTDFDLVFN